MASQRERLIQLSQPPLSTLSISSTTSQHAQMPLAYKMRGLDGGYTTMSPAMYSTIDYVNVNQQRNLASPQPSTSPWLLNLQQQQQQQLSLPHRSNQQFSADVTATSSYKPKQNGVKLVCDIDQVFPVPEVSIYRLGKVDGSHPDKLAKLDTRIERNSLTGLYHVQVMSLLEDDELQMKYGLNEPVYFECLIALTNLELSKYADNKRSIVYRPGSPGNSLQGEDISLDPGSGSASRGFAHQTKLLILVPIMLCLGQLLIYHNL